MEHLNDLARRVRQIYKANQAAWLQLAEQGFEAEKLRLQEGLQFKKKVASLRQLRHDRQLPDKQRLWIEQDIRSLDNQGVGLLKAGRFLPEKPPALQGIIIRLTCLHDAVFRLSGPIIQCKDFHDPDCGEPYRSVAYFCMLDDVKSVKPSDIAQIEAWLDDVAENLARTNSQLKEPEINLTPDQVEKGNRKRKLPGQQNPSFCHVEALSSFIAARKEVGDDDKKECYAWIVKNKPDGYSPPPYGSWKRYVNHALKVAKEQEGKNAKLPPRNSSKSILRKEDNEVDDLSEVTSQIQPR